MEIRDFRPRRELAQAALIRELGKCGRPPMAIEPIAFALEERFHQLETVGPLRIFPSPFSGLDFSRFDPGRINDHRQKKPAPGWGQVFSVEMGLGLWLVLRTAQR